MDSQIIVKEENRVKYESCDDMAQSTASHYPIYLVENKHEEKQEDGNVQSCNLQVKSEDSDQKINIKYEPGDDTYIKQESLENHELDIKTEINDDCADQTMKKPIGRKSLQCNVCYYKCPKKSSLQQHMKIHTGEKPFQCEICDYKCVRRNDLQRHIKVHTKEKLFQCDRCDYKCFRKNRFEMHMNIHTGEKPFQCDICNYKCFRKTVLQRHMKIHTKEKPFQCDIRNCKFSQKSS